MSNEARARRRGTVTLKKVLEKLPSHHCGWLQLGFSSSSAKPSRPLAPVAIAKTANQKKPASRDVSPEEGSIAKFYCINLLPQLTTTYYSNLLLHTTIYYYKLLLHTTTYCILLHLTATYYNVLQLKTTYYNSPQFTTIHLNVLQTTTSYYKLLQVTTSLLLQVFLQLQPPLQPPLQQTLQQPLLQQPLLQQQQLTTTYYNLLQFCGDSRVWFEFVPVATRDVFLAVLWCLQNPFQLSPHVC